MCNRSLGVGSNGKLMHWVFIAAFFAAFAVAIAPSYATQLHFQYRSTDMSEIEVNLGVVRLDKSGRNLLIGHRDPKTKEFVESRPIRTIRIPRAYIRSALPYTRRFKWGNPAAGHKHLPDKVFANSLQLRLSYPDGIPHTVSRANWRRQKPDMTDPLVGNTTYATTARDQQRLLEINASIRPQSNGMAHRTGSRGLRFYPGSRFDKGVQGTFRRYETSTEVYLYDDHATHDVFQIECNRIERSRPLVFCEYTLALNSHVRAVLRFVDYRFHGGIPFLRERVRVFKKVMCPIFECDVADPALRGAAFIGDKRRVCTHFDPAKRPKREVTLGFSKYIRLNYPNITESEWEASLQKHRNELLTLNLPEDYIGTLKMARDRHGIATHVKLNLFETDMSPSLPVKRQFWDPPHDIGDVPATCLRWGEVSMGEMDHISSYLTLTIGGLEPAEMQIRPQDEHGCFKPPRGRSVERRHDLDYDGMTACKYSGLNYNHVSFNGQFESVSIGFTGIDPKQPGALHFRHKNLHVGFRTQSLSNWRAKYKKVVTFLERVIVQKDSQ